MGLRIWIASSIKDCGKMVFFVAWNFRYFLYEFHCNQLPVHITMYIDLSNDPQWVPHQMGHINVGNGCKQLQTESREMEGEMNGIPLNSISWHSRSLDSICINSCWKFDCKIPGTAIGATVVIAEFFFFRWMINPITPPAELFEVEKYIEIEFKKTI